MSQPDGSAGELDGRTVALERRIAELETENHHLRHLLGLNDQPSRIPSREPALFGESSVTAGANVRRTSSPPITRTA